MGNDEIRLVKGDMATVAAEASNEAPVDVAAVATVLEPSGLKHPDAEDDAVVIGRAVKAHALQAVRVGDVEVEDHHVVSLVRVVEGSVGEVLDEGVAVLGGTD